MMGASVKSLAIMGIAAFISGILSRRIAKTITLSPETQRNYPELQKRLNGWLSGALKNRAHVGCLCGGHAAAQRLGLIRFLELASPGAGEKTVDETWLSASRLILFFSAVGWTVLASLIENRLASDIHGRPLPSARTRTLLTVPQCAGGGDRHHNSDDPAL